MIPALGWNSKVPSQNNNKKKISFIIPAKETVSLVHVVEELLIAGGFQGKDNQVNHSPVDGPTPVSVWAAESGIPWAIKKRT